MAETLSNENKEYVFNSELFSTLAVRLGIKRKMILQTLSIPPSTWDKWKEIKDVPVFRLVEICNLLRIPISWFITYEGYQKQESFMPMCEENWTPIEYKPILLADWLLYGKGLSVDEACSEIGCYPSFFYKHFRPHGQGALSISRFLTICNRLKVWPGTWLINHNDRIVLIPGYTRIVWTEATAEDAKRMKMTSDDLKKQLKQANAQIQELRAQIQTLEEKNRQMLMLANKYREELEQVQSQKGNAQTTFTAAEDSSDYNTHEE